VPRPTRLAALLLTGILAASTLAACGSDDSSSSASSGAKKSVTLYNAQHEELMKAMTDAFTQQSGIKVEIRNGSDLEMANQLVQEGDASPADVFVTENSPAMTLVDGRKLFTPVEGPTAEQVPARYRPASNDWVGFAARQTVFVYNTAKPAAKALPASIMDLADPKWKGKFGYSPTGADFQAIVSAVLALEGEAKAKAWLEGLKRNAVAYQGNSKVMAAVNKGDVEGGVIYHYYWYQDQAESGADSKNTKLHFFGAQDPGAFTSVSGAGVLASSDSAPEAQQLVRFLTGKAGQQVLADSTALEYTVASGVPANPALRPLAELDAPVVDVDQLNSEQVVTLMSDAGIL
jgi:iron(III) transport system substrate-binding protein